MIKGNVPPDDRGHEMVRLSAEEAELARTLLAKLLTVDARESQPTPAADEPASAQQIMSLAKSVYQSRRRRAEHFGPAIFSEPAWDMLLVLYIYGNRGDQMSVTRLAEFSQSPLTTAIRWLDYLESQRLIMRSQCSHDRRKFFVSLSEKGQSMMTDYFRSLLDGKNRIPLT